MPSLPEAASLWMPPSYLTVCFPVYTLSNLSLPSLTEPEIVNGPTLSLPPPEILLSVTSKLFQIISSSLPLCSYDPLTFIQLQLIVPGFARERGMAITVLCLYTRSRDGSR